jgi:arginase family enzyme
VNPAPSLRPPWSRHTGGLFSFPYQNLEEPSERVEIAVLSAAFDGTESSKGGARYGPAAIRDASLVYSSQQSSRNSRALYDCRTGERLLVRSRSALDFGDCCVAPGSAERQVEAVERHVAELLSRAGHLVLLGGEHTITSGAFAAAHNFGSGRGRRIGYVHIDHHFDFGDTSAFHGRYYHGSVTRRVSEVEGMAIDRILFFGQGDLTDADQYRALEASGCILAPLCRLGTSAVSPVFEEKISLLMRRSDELYVSIDVDVCANAEIAGTGNFSTGGLHFRDLLDMGRILKKYPVRVLDVVEVNPLLDPGGHTAMAAARFLFDWLFLEKEAADG